MKSQIKYHLSYIFLDYYIDLYKPPWNVTAVVFIGLQGSPSSLINTASQSSGSTDSTANSLHGGKNTQ